MIRKAVRSGTSSADFAFDKPQAVVASSTGQRYLRGSLGIQLPLVILAQASHGVLGRRRRLPRPRRPGGAWASSSCWWSSRSSRGPSSSIRASPCAAPTPSPRPSCDVFRKSSKFSEVNSVCVAAQGEPAGRRVPGRLPGGEPAGARAARRAAPPPAPAQPTVRSLESLSRALVRAATVEVDAARAARDLPRHHRERHAVHRPLRNGRGAS